MSLWSAGDSASNPPPRQFACGHVHHVWHAWCSLAGRVSTMRNAFAASFGCTRTFRLRWSWMGGLVWVIACGSLDDPQSGSQEGGSAGMAGTDANAAGAGGSASMVPLALAERLGPAAQRGWGAKMLQLEPAERPGVREQAVATVATRGTRAAAEVGARHRRAVALSAGSSLRTPAFSHVATVRPTTVRRGFTRLHPAQAARARTRVTRAGPIAMHTLATGVKPISRSRTLAVPAECSARPDKSAPPLVA